MTGSFEAALQADNGEPVVKAQPLRFQTALDLPRSDYVPEPVALARGPVHPLDSLLSAVEDRNPHGWSAIEPWPERKPVLGWDNEGDPEVADWHIKYWIEHGITGVIYCWYRSNLNGPVTQTLGHAIHDGLLQGPVPAAHQVRHHVGKRLRPRRRFDARLAR